MDPPRCRPPAPSEPGSKSTKRTNSGRVKHEQEHPLSRPPSTSSSRLSNVSSSRDSALSLSIHIPIQSPIPVHARQHIDALLRHHDFRDVQRWLHIVWQTLNPHSSSSTNDADAAPPSSCPPPLITQDSFNSTDTVTNRSVSTGSSAPSSLHPASAGVHSRRVSSSSLFSLAQSTTSIGSDLTAYTDSSAPVVPYVSFGQPQPHASNGHGRSRSMFPGKFQPVEWPKSGLSSSMSQAPAAYTPSPHVRPAALSTKSSISLKEGLACMSPRLTKPDEAPKQQKFVCTSCETKFIRKSDWKQHEERLHERRNQWRCPDCNLDQLWSRNQFKQHHKGAHGCENCPHSDVAVIPLKKRTAWGCGFCGELHHDWEERCQHVAQHYEKGKLKSEWKHSNVIWGLLHQPDIHSLWRELLHQKHGSRPNPRPSYSWDRKSTGRSHDVSQADGKPTKLQDLLEFGNEDRNVHAIVQMAYELGIVSPSKKAGDGTPHDATDFDSSIKAEGFVFASPSPTAVRVSVLTANPTTSTIPELSRQQLRRASSKTVLSSTTLSTSSNSSPNSVGLSDASPTYMFSPVQQLAGQLSVTDVSTPTGTPSMTSQMAPHMSQQMSQEQAMPQHMSPSMFSNHVQNGHLSTGPSWTPAQASNYHQMQYAMDLPPGITAATSEKPLPQLPQQHYDSELALMPHNRFSDDPAFLFSSLDDDASTFVDHMSFTFAPDDGMACAEHEGSHL